MHVETQVLEHRLDGLLGEGRIAQGVAGPLQTDHQAIADQLAVARAAQDRDVLDPGRDGGRGGETKRERRESVAALSPAHSDRAVRLDRAGYGDAAVVVADPDDVSDRAVLQR